MSEAVNDSAPLRCRLFGHDVPVRGEIETAGHARYERVECERCGVEWVISLD